MVAGHENISRSGQTANLARANLDDLAQSGSHGQFFIGFALDFASAAANALACILKQIVLTHGFPPFE
jgi:hypothetical protein